jgi:hypothetical protein
MISTANGGSGDHPSNRQPCTPRHQPPLPGTVSMRPGFSTKFSPKTRLKSGPEPPNHSSTRAFTSNLCDVRTDSSKLVMRVRFPSPALVSPLFRG